MAMGTRSVRSKAESITESLSPTRSEKSEESIDIVHAKRHDQDRDRVLHDDSALGSSNAPTDDTEEELLEPTLQSPSISGTVNGGRHNGVARGRTPSQPEGHATTARRLRAARGAIAPHKDASDLDSMSALSSADTQSRFTGSVDAETETHATDSSSANAQIAHHIDSSTAGEELVDNSAETSERFALQNGHVGQEALIHDTPSLKRSSSSSSLSSELSELSSISSIATDRSQVSVSTTGSNTIRQLESCQYGEEETRQEIIQRALEMTKKWKKAWDVLNKRVQANIKKQERTRAAREQIAHVRKRR